MSTIAITSRQPAASRVAAAARTVGDAVSDTADVAWRNLLTQLRTPQALVFSVIQPVIFVLLFRYAFGGAIHVPGTNYVDFLMPGIFAQTVAFGAVGTAVGLSGDVRTGILVRFRTLPMARIAVLAGRTAADLARNLLVVAVMIGVGFAAGFRSPHGAGALLAALGLVIAFGYAISWGFASLGLRVSDPEAAQAAAEFELGCHLHSAGHKLDAVPHFEEAHRLDPDNWSYLRQAFAVVDDDMGNPYGTDLLSEVARVGPDTFYPELTI